MFADHVHEESYTSELAHTTELLPVTKQEERWDSKHPQIGRHRALFVDVDFDEASRHISELFEHLGQMCRKHLAVGASIAPEIKNHQLSTHVDDVVRK